MTAAFFYKRSDPLATGQYGSLRHARSYVHGRHRGINRSNSWTFRQAGCRPHLCRCVRRR
jgi:hypothetical protein